MRLYILRHGSSPTLQEAGVLRDADRPLSKEGRLDVRRMTAYLREQGGAPEIILTSPLLRATQTAQEASVLLQPRLGVKTFAPLENRLGVQDLHPKVMDEARGLRELLAVGHVPQLVDWVSFLSGSMVNLKAGGLAVLEQEGARFRLLWARSPSDLASGSPHGSRPG